jgi:Flp pilus assembly pilin Flp
MGVESLTRQRRTDWNSHPSCGVSGALSPSITRLDVSNRSAHLITQLLVTAFSRLRFNEDGQTLVEYALILVLVSTAAFTLLSAIGGFPASVFSEVNAGF